MLSRSEASPRASRGDASLRLSMTDLDALRAQPGMKMTAALAAFFR
jgi:hypothetical protein